MTRNPLPLGDPAQASRMSARTFPGRGYVPYAIRAERTLGWILWIALAVIIVVGSV